jgi:hypothetical protein
MPNSEGGEKWQAMPRKKKNTRRANGEGSRYIANFPLIPVNGEDSYGQD